MADLTKIFERYKYDKNIETKSKTWFQQQVILLGNKRISPSTLLNQEKLTANVVPGRLYLFYYDPKYKDVLPYYDKFPLVFPYAKTPNGFIGLNMHYLPHYWRVKLLSRLMQFSSNQKMDETTKIKYSWNLISGVSKFKIAEPCIKQYLKEHVQSPFVNIMPADWHTAMMLPVERFVGASKQQIWGDSSKWLR